MNTSTYYNLKLVEGTDIVNPLTTDVPNYETIDEQMHNNSIAGVTLATEVATGKVHALIRENNECAVIRFVATSKWSLGDTITVDGIPVVAVLPSGEALDEGAYVVNANVLCILSGTNLTVYAVKNKKENASDIKYNDTNVGAELDELNGSVAQINASVEQINTNFAKHTFGDAVNVTSNMGSGYTVPSDGYIEASSKSTSGSYIKFKVNGITNTAVGGTGFYPQTLIYVKKDMILTHESTNYPNHAYIFHPLV